jgi:hypothetical protein
LGLSGWLRRVMNAKWLDGFMGRTSRPSRADTATRMAMDADFTHSSRTTAERRCEVKDDAVDPLEELVRLPHPETANQLQTFRLQFVRVEERANRADKARSIVPLMRRLWPPAAATSRARLALSCP